ncbi:MAG: endonuclease/exonuclease/phosphatase family protein [Bacteroidia bacterium]|nr:endonuclease/exonuclease/phosphatase family protein [Bacteroidia bacterium]
MSKLIFLVILVLMGLQSHAQELGFMTYNLRYDNPNDGENRWDLRKEFLRDQLKFFEPDVMGIQEGLKHQLDYLNIELDAYTYIGVGRDDGKEKGEYTAIFYKEDELGLIKESTFWLSENPEEISVGWDAALERICTYALFEEKASGKKFYVFNTHFDHRGEKARRKSAQLILKQIKALNVENFPVVLMGDLNLTPDTKAIKSIANKLDDSRHAARIAFGPDATFTGFDFSKAPQRRIDYIFTSPANMEVKKYAVLTDSRDQKYPSDHFPVYIKVQLK